MVAADPYAVLFRDYIARSVAQDLQTLHATPHPLPEAIRVQAMHSLEYGLHEPACWQQVCDLVLALAPLMERGGYRHSWEPVVETALRQSQRQNDSLSTARLRFHLGVLCQRQARLEAAEQYLHQSAATLVHAGYPEEAARAMSTLADILRRTRRFTEAERLVEQALRLARAAPCERAYGRIVQGAIAYDRRAWQEALLAFEQACADAGDAHLREKAWALTNAGATHQRLAQWPQAIACFRRALPLLDRLQDVVFAAVTRMNLGNVYLTRAEPLLALPWYQQAETVFIETESWRPLASLKVNRGMAYHQLARWGEAEEAYRQSLALWRILKNGYQEANVLDGLGSLLAEQGRKAEARSTFHQALALLYAGDDHEHLRRAVTEHLHQLEE
jgi:tetratricopeptide (TPR) repeat protein